MRKDKILILVSGGMDSVTLLYYLKNQGHYLEAVSFNYGSKHNKKELTFAKYHTNKLGIEHTVFDLEPIFKEFKSSLIDENWEVPEGFYTEETMKQTVVPFRNGILLSIAAGLAESKDLNKIALASHSGDHAIYPDCRPEFNRVMQEAVKVGTWKGIEFIAPFENMTKVDIVSLGLRLGVDYSKTWSCYKGGDKPCGKCGTCIERTEAFYLNNVIDPLVGDEKEWRKFVNYYLEFKERWLNEKTSL